MEHVPQLNPASIIIGFDVHKYSHTGVAMDVMGQELGKIELNNQQLDKGVVWINQWDAAKVVVGIEDVHSYGHHLTKKLVQAGLTVLYVPAKLTDRERKHSRQKDKTDYEDAKRVGKVILNKIEQTLPADPIVAEDQQQIAQLDLLLQERDSLIKQQTQLKNHLHALLHQHYGDTYKQDFANVFSTKSVNWYLTDLETNQDYLTQAITRRLKRLQLVQAHIKEITKELKQAAEQVPAIKDLEANLHGCGNLTACKIMAEIKTIARFSSADKLARYGGCAPISYQSGNRGRHYTDRGGNRRLNQAIHTVALSQIARYKKDESQTYYEKKIAEGKSKLWALRCLKRQIVKHIYKTLQ
jgi:transposase